MTKFYRLIVGDAEPVIEFFILKGIISRHKTCLSCFTLMSFVSRAKNIDGRAYRCMQSGCDRRKCYTYLRKGIFFYNIKISLPKCLHLLYYFAIWRSQKQAIEDTECGKFVVNAFYTALQKRCE